jgi:hypothetical protein
LITEKFGIPVLSTYEAVEAFKIGFECHQRVGVHLNVDLYPMRIVNAQGDTVEIAFNSIDRTATGGKFRVVVSAASKIGWG